MKPIYITAVGILLMPCLATRPGMAQDQPASTPQASMQQRTPDEVVNTLATKLNLTDDQKQQIKPIIADRQQKLAALRSDTSMRPMKKLKKVRGIFHDSDQKIEAVLNDQQKQQYIQIEQQMKDQIRQRAQDRSSMGGMSSQ